MNNNQIRALRGYFDREDFKKTWLGIASDIKIRKFDNLNNIPEFRELPNEFQNQMRNRIPLNDDSEILDHPQYFNRFYAILLTKQKEKYLALYQEKKPSVNTQALLTGIGIGSIFFLWNIFKYLEETQKLTTNKTSYQMTTFNRMASYTSNHYLMVILAFVSPIAAYFLTRTWLSDSDLRHKQLVHACVLKKLESITNSG
jgi:hypothetical protein